jgi:5-methylcytosine-specific restriction endonuclease McrA
MNPPPPAGDAIALAEKIFALLDEGQFTATYKYAVLLALMDICLAQTTRAGAAPSTITTRQLAEQVIRIYWPHCLPFHGGDRTAVLRQSRGGRDSQAAIIRRIERFRTEVAPENTIAGARKARPEGFEALVRDVEWKLIQMPLPRLQRIGGREEQFLYAINWTEAVALREVRSYQRDRGSDFDSVIRLVDGVGDDLVRLNGLLRPLIQRQWAALVAAMNALEESRLEHFLFGSQRTSLDRVRFDLAALQRGRCFYCDDRLGREGTRAAHVDHFIPWSRYPNNAIENLVVAHDRCNHAKRHHLAAAEHVAHWIVRFEGGNSLANDLHEIATLRAWETSPGVSLGVARGVYLRLPPDMPLWLRGAELVTDDLPRVRTLLS